VRGEENLTKSKSSEKKDLEDGKGSSVGSEGRGKLGKTDGTDKGNSKDNVDGDGKSGGTDGEISHAGGGVDGNGRNSRANHAERSEVSQKTEAKSAEKSQTTQKEEAKLTPEKEIPDDFDEEEEIPDDFIDDDTETLKNDEGSTIDSGNKGKIGGTEGTDKGNSSGNVDGDGKSGKGGGADGKISNANVGADGGAENADRTSEKNSSANAGDTGKIANGERGEKRGGTRATEAEIKTAVDLANSRVFRSTEEVVFMSKGTTNTFSFSKNLQNLTTGFGSGEKYDAIAVRSDIMEKMAGDKQVPQWMKGIMAGQEGVRLDGKGQKSYFVFACPGQVKNVSMARSSSGADKAR
jgi:hypothetical protein